MKKLNFGFNNEATSCKVPERKLIIGQFSIETIVWCDRIEVESELDELGIFVKCFSGKTIVTTLSFHKQPGVKEEMSHLLIEAEKYHLYLKPVFKNP